MNKVLLRKMERPNAYSVSHAVSTGNLKVLLKMKKLVTEKKMFFRHSYCVFTQNTKTKFHLASFVQI